MNKKYKNTFLTFTVIISFVALYISFQTLHSIIVMDGNEEFYKAVFSSIVGGLFTIFGIAMAIMYFIKRDSENKKELKSKERLKIKPYLTLKALDTSEIEEKSDVKIHFNPKAILGKGETKKLFFKIENVGAGPALEIKVFPGTIRNIENTRINIKSTNILKSESKILEIQLDDKYLLDCFNITVSYWDIYNNIYSTKFDVWIDEKKNKITYLDITQKLLIETKAD